MVQLVTLTYRVPYDNLMHFDRLLEFSKFDNSHNISRFVLIAIYQLFSENIFGSKTLLHQNQ